MATGAIRKQSRRGRVGQAARVGRLLAVGGLLLMALSAVAAAVWQLQRLPVQRVVVSSELRQLPREQLQARVSASLQGGFLLLDLQHIRDSLEALPWVYRAVVKRRWPGIIEIQVSEQFPIARWTDEGYLNHAGELFRSQQVSNDSELPRLAGPAGSQRRVMDYYKQVQDGLQGTGLGIAALRMDVRGALRARLEDGVELILGRSELAARMTRFRDLYRHSLARQQGRLARVDLRYSHGAAVAWAETIAMAGERG